jgi:ABC-2 type transport system permease protein
MRIIGFLLEKEFRQIFRDPAILRIIFVMPVVQLIVLPFAADYEIKNINLSVVDQDQSSYSQKLTRKMTASGYFRLSDYSSTYEQALEAAERERADIVLTIPPRFERTLVRESEASLMLSANAINGVKAGLGVAYASQIIQDFNREIREDWLVQPRFNEMPLIELRASHWYNPHIDYQLFMVPGILAVLVTMVGAFLAAMNIVREKEVGAIEQINVTPVRKHQFLLGKLIPFWVLGLLSLALGFVVSWAVYGIVPAGSYALIFLFAGAYLLAVLGIGLLVSTYADTQQQATLIAFFFMMIFILLSGLYTPVESMPAWARVISWLNPVTHFVTVIRAVVIKGSTLAHIFPELITVLGFAVLYNVWAVLNYRKRQA